MTLGTRVFLGYFLIVGIGGYIFLHLLMKEIKPAIRQTTEETLIDMAVALAEVVKVDVATGKIDPNGVARMLDDYSHRHLDIRIGDQIKSKINHRIYITDATGRVIYDSDQRDVGRDFSRWNDVYLTLRGKYGARSTRMDPQNELSSVMHVAAPIRYQGRLVGVLTVAKPNVSVQPFIEGGRKKMALVGVVLLVISLAFGALFSWHLSASIGRVTSYATRASRGERVSPPHFYGGELAQLSRSVAELRNQVDGRAYVERYVHTLTHEMKSPLSAIRGAAELLEEPMAPADQKRFLSNIRMESDRLRELVDRLLDLAMVEQRAELQERNPVLIAPLFEELLASRAPAMEKKVLTAKLDADAHLHIIGEKFLLIQAIGNLLDNAIDFAPPRAQLMLAARSVGDRVEIDLFNPGAPIPEFAQPRLYERFFSLPRPDTGKKSTGLGLSFVREVVLLHGGQITIENQLDGVLARLRFPLT